MIKDQKEREAKDFSKTIAALQAKLQAEKERTTTLEKKLRQDREAFATKMQNLNSSIELRSIETTVNQSNKSKSKPSAAYAKSLSGSKTSTAENKSIGGATNAY